MRKENSKATELTPTDATNTAVAVVDTNTAVAVPNDHIMGFEGMDMSDIRLPYARLIQPIMLADDKYAGMAAGAVMHELLHEALPTGLVPLTIKDDKILFGPQREEDRPTYVARIKAATGADITTEDFQSPYLCRAQDNHIGDRFGPCAQCKLAEWDGKSKPLCTKNINVLALFDGQDVPCILRFNSTSYKHGQKFKQTAFMAKRHLFSTHYKLGTIKKEEPRKVWYEMTLTPNGLLSEADVATAYQARESFGPLFASQLSAAVSTEPVTAVTTEY